MECCTRDRRGESRQKTYTQPAASDEYYIMDLEPSPVVPRPLPAEVRDRIMSRNLRNRVVIFSSTDLAAFGDYESYSPVDGAINCGEASSQVPLAPISSKSAALASNEARIYDAVIQPQDDAAVAASTATEEYPQNGVNALLHSEFRAEGCNNCLFIVLESVKSVTIDQCENCSFVLFCEGSIFLRECKNFTLSCVCKQLRLRGSSGRTAGLVKTAPVIEHCNNVIMGQFGIRCDNPEITAECEKEARRCGVDASENKIDAVYDFTPLDGAKNFTIREEFCGVEINRYDNVEYCGIIPVWSGFFGNVGINCTERAMHEIAHYNGNGRPTHAVSAYRIGAAERKRLQFEKDQFDYYVIIDQNIERELSESVFGKEFLFLSAEDVERLRRLRL